MRGRVVVSRRAVLGAALAVPVVAACTSTPPPPPPPDPLAELAARARADAGFATAVAGAVPELAGPAGQVAKVRSEHAEALQKEADRERPPRGSASAAPLTSAPAVPPGAGEAKAAMASALTAAEQRIGELITSVPRYRAGLLGSVAGGCASLREVLA